jgi:glyoxylase-like metal-dependent hydrolase (beta-lactamase superfamily II)
MSHGHLDHTGGLFSHARAHYLLFQKTPTYYVPSDLVDKLRNVEMAMWALDSANSDDGERSNVDPPPPGMPINIVGVHPGDEISLGKTKHGER